MLYCCPLDPYRCPPGLTLTLTLDPTLTNPNRSVQRAWGTNDLTPSFVIAVKSESEQVTGYEKAPIRHQTLSYDSGTKHIVAMTADRL